MRLVAKSFLLHLEEEITLGELKLTLLAQVMGTKDAFDIEHTDNFNISYMGIEINGWQDWKKFRDFHKGMGIDFDKAIQSEFEKIFDVPNVKLFVDRVAF